MSQPVAAPAERRSTPTEEDFQTPEFIERSLDLTLAFNRALIDDPGLAASLPRGVTVVLLPEDVEQEPEFVELSIALGLEAIREGRDVLFHHMPGPAPSERR